MGLSNIFDISGSALSAQSKRLNVVASNLANVDSKNPDGTPYRAKHVVFESVLIGNKNLNSDLSLNVSSSSVGVKVKDVIEDSKDAPGNGGKADSSVNVVQEMVDMISASRSYQNNVEVMNAAKTLMQKTLTLGN